MCQFTLKLSLMQTKHASSYPRLIWLPRCSPAQRTAAALLAISNRSSFMWDSVLLVDCAALFLVLVFASAAAVAAVSRVACAESAFLRIPLVDAALGFVKSPLLFLVQVTVGSFILHRLFLHYLSCASYSTSGAGLPNACPTRLGAYRCRVTCFPNEFTHVACPPPQSTQRLFIISYIIIVVCFILVGQYSGNLSFTKSFHAMASSPAGFMTTVRGLDVPLSNLAASLVSGVIAPFMSGIRSTLLASVSLDDLAVDAQCVVSGLASSLPDATVLVGFLDNVNSSLTSLSSDANALQSNISQIDASLSRSVALTTSLSSNLTVLSNTSAAFNGTLGVLTPLLAVLAANITTFLSPVTGLPVAHGTAVNARTVCVRCLLTLLSLTSTAAANNTIRYLPWQSNAIALVSSSPSMNALLAGTYDGNGGTNNRLALRASLAAFQANISRVPNLAATASLLSNVTSFVVTFRSSGLLDAVDVSLGSSDIALASVPSAATLAVVLNSVQEFLDSLSLVGLRTAIHSFNDTLTTLPTTVPIRAEVRRATA